MKTDVERLIANPVALRRFCDLLVDHATVAGIDAEIDKISDQLRIQLAAARDWWLDTGNLLELRRNKQNTYPLTALSAHRVSELQ
jgi:hypothetical protein